MAHASLSFTRPDGSVGVIELDALISLSHSAQTLIPEHEVETGANVSDDIRPKLDTLKVEAIVSDAPLASMSSDSVAMARGGGRSRSFTVYTLLEAIRLYGYPLTLKTDLQDYAPRLLQSFEITQNKETGEALKISLTLKEVRYAESQVVTLVFPKQKVLKGRQQAEPITPEGRHVTGLQQPANTAGTKGMAAALGGLPNALGGSATGGG